MARTGSHPAVRLKQDHRTLRNSGQLTPWLTDRGAFDAGLCDARRLYLALCVKQQCKALEISQPALGSDKREEQAKKLATSALKKALRNWFGVSDKEFEAWHAAQPARSTQIELELDEEDPAPGAPV
ncbi:hypothetical protein SLITK23_59110 [Streptomyces lividans]|uniref:hypothetical protein n=1 Tax=Streptomyces lividans TaxID=1916 RepID=UPI0001C59E7A|nr:hypothetical protein [Streptomyces lividans]EFD66009.1 predicted protein [Streptomyces lividans TK24]BDE42666.1 hypothetical protein SLITK23_59110 [Streptomyces lividans]